MKKFFSVETTENLIDAELGLLPTQNDTAIDGVLFAQIDEIASSEIDPGSLNVVLNEDAVIEDGYIIIDGVAIPTEIAEGEVEEIEPEAAPIALSGGGSAQPFELGDIGPNIDITDLLPPTALLFTIPEEEDLDPFVDGNDTPDVEVFPDDPVDPNLGGPSILPIDAVVGEPALPGGSEEGSGGEVTTGDLIVDTGTDELDTLVINDVDVTTGGTVEGDYGTLTITVNPDGTYEYIYVLTDNTIDHPDTGSVGTAEGITDDFTVVVTDDDGDTASDTLVVGIIDDGPVAVVDTATQDEEGAPVTLDVFDNDSEGADSVNVDTGLEIVPGSLSGDGTLVDNGDGTVTYTPAPGEDGDITFEYVITDGDGDTSTAVGTITLVDDSEPTLVVNPEASLVDEAALDADGSNPTSNAETTAGDFTIDTGNDTVGSLVIDGVDVTTGGTVTGTYGVLTVTETDGAYTWVYVLTDSTADHASGDVTDEFAVVVTDSDGDTASDTLVVAIDDDVPTANDDTGTQTGEDTPITVDVFDNDVPGADGVDADTGIAVVPNTLSGNGTLIDNGDGTFTYTPEPGEEGAITFDYEITDADGDTSIATVTITLEDDSTPTIDVAPAASSVDEAALDAAGSDPTSTAEITTGDFTIDTGNDTIGTLVIDGVDVTNGGTVTGTYGILTVTETGGAYSWSYELNDNTTDHANGAVADDFTVVVTDSDGDTATDTLVVDIIDDAPSAENDSNTATEGGPAATGNVLDNDTVGADDGVIGTDSVVSLDSPAVGTFGTLTLNPDGSYSYTPNASVPAGSMDSFDYTLTDADGDTTTATLTITFEGDNNAPTATTDASTLSDISGDDNTDGSNADAFVPVSDSGDLSFDFGLDGAGTFDTSYDGGLGVATTSSAAGSTTIAADDGSWTLVIDETTGAYTFTQNTAYDHEAAADTDAGIITVTITDSDGSPISVDINLAIDDDVPTATNDADTATEGGPVVTGDVLINDDIGADHGTVGTDSVVSLDSPAVGTFGTLTLNADGTYSYTPNASVPAGSMDSFDYTVTDADGDAATATLIITFEGDNNVPVAQPNEAALSDISGDDNTDGSNADAFVEQSTSGSLTFDFGLDGPAATDSFAVSYDGNLGPATTTSSAGVTTLTADDGSWNITIDESTGEYTFTQTGPYTHDVGANSDEATLTVTITDGDGSTSEVSLSLTIGDDVPVANDDSFTAEEALPGYVGNVLDNDDIGADHGTVGTDSFVTLISPSAGTFGNLTLNADGSYSYDPLISVPAGSVDTYEYMVTDADGDTSTATLTITFTGDNNTPFATADASTLSDVSGDDNTDGSNADAFVPVSDNGDLAFNYGADGAGTFDTSYDGGLGVATTSSAAGSTTIAADDGSWTLVIDETTGEYTFTQNTAYDHEAGADTDAGIVTVTITDSDGSPISVDINLAIDDDVPTATNDADTATEGGPVVTGDVLINDDIGADHGTVGTDSVVSLDSPAVGTFGTLTLNADGTYSYTPNASVPAGSMDSFDYTVTDADGDTATATLIITFEGDNNVPTAGTTTALADEDDLADGIGNTDSAGDNDATNLTGTLTHDYGLDGSGSITLLDGAQTVNGVDYTYTVGTDINGDQVITANDGVQDVFTLTLTDNVTGTYEVELLASIEHLGTDPAFEDNLLFNLGYRVEDSDGSTADGTFALTVDDDIPVEIENEIPAVRVDEDELPGGITDGDFTTTVDMGDVSNLVNFGADQPGEFGLGSNTSGLPALTSGGVAITYAVANDVLTASAGATDVFTLDMNTDGTFTFTLLAQIDHPIADGNDTEALNIDFASIITATDSDGDVITLTQGVFVAIEDDVPVAMDDVAATAEDQTVEIDVFADNGNGVDMAGADGVDLVNDVTFDDTGTAGTVVYNGDGTFDFTPTSGFEGDTSFTYTFLDGDGDPATATVTISVAGDSEPTVTVTDLTVNEDGLANGTASATDSETDASGVMTIATGADSLTQVEIQDAGGVWIDVTAATVGTPITVNGDDGILTVTSDGAGNYSYSYTLSTNDDHPDTDPNDGDGISDAADPLPGDEFAVRVSDNDGDTSTDTPGDAGTINITVLDDAPIATLELEAGASLIIDESLGENSGEFEGGASGLGQVTITAGNLFSNTSEFGADGAAATGSTVYSLNITSNASTGLVDVATGQPITLEDNAGVIEGQNTNGEVVFTISVDNDPNSAGFGDMTVTQFRALEHDDDMDPDEAASPEILGAGFVELEVQITDGDGDVDTASVDLGGVISFEDDGPVIDAAVTDGDTVLLTTQDAETIGAATDTDSSTANFGSAFTIDGASYGSDGAGTTVWAYELTVDNAVSGMSSDGDAINLFLIGGEVVGSTAADAGSVTVGNTIFSIGTNATTGEVTLTQFAEIDHELPGASSNYDTQLEVLADGLVSLEGTATITDRDGDSASETVSLDLGGNIQFADDGPAVTATPTMATLTVDETDFATDANADLSGAFVVNYGADGAGTTTYGLNISANDADSGLVDVANGEAVLLRINGSGDVEGYSSAGVVFTVSVDANGVVELDQARAVQHPDAMDNDDSVGLTGSNLITLNATATDGDGDTAVGTIDLTGALAFEDDGPDATLSGAALDTLTLDESPVPVDGDGIVSVSADFADNFGTTIDYGNDGAGSVSYALGLDGNDIASGMFALGVNGAQGDAIVLNLVGDDIVGSANGTTYFTISVDNDPNSATFGEVTFAQSENIYHSDTNNDDDTSSLSVAADILTITQTVTDRDGDSDAAVIDLGTGVFSIEDDGPSASANGDPIDTLVLDESPVGTETDGDSDPVGLASVTANLGDNFTTTDYGTDGAGNVSYVLALSADGIGSGLFALGVNGAQGDEIELTQVGNIVTGAINGTTYFTITIDPSNGDVTFAQENNIWHATTSDDDDTSTLNLTGMDTLSVTQTVTDADGDSASASIQLGSGVFSIEDDGPNVEVSASGDEIALDETAAGEDFVSGPIMVTSTDSVLDLDTLDYGTDGMGSLSYAITGSGATTLATADGDQAITLEQTNATTITGTFNGGSETAFTVVINTDGTITVTQNVALEHNTDGDNALGEHNDTLDLSGLILATATITDADGDTDASSAAIGDQIVFYDDGPSIEFDQNINVNEDFVTGGNEQMPFGPGDVPNTSETGSDFATINFGADGAGSLDVAITAAGPAGGGGLGSFPLTTGGVAIVTDWNEGTGILTGYTTDMNDPVFILEVNVATGEYEFTLIQPIDHPYTDSDLENDGPDTAYEDLFSIEFTATVTDADGDTASDSFLVIINDDSAHAADDAANTSEDTLVVIDVDDNDAFGADGVDLATGITFDDTGTEGTVVYNGDGTFDFTPDAGFEGDTTFTYTLTDYDGDADTATVTITVGPDSTPTVSVTDLSVNEDGLADGTSSATDSETDNSGVVTIDTAGDTLDTIEIQDAGGIWIDVTAATVGTPIMVMGDDGTLTVTSDGSGNYSYSYTLTDNLLTHPDTIDGGDGDGNSDGADTVIGDTFDVRVTDSDGDVSPVDTIDVTVLDDAPVDFTPDAAAVGNTGVSGSSDANTFDLNFDAAVGADQDGNVVFGPSLDGTPATDTDGNLLFLDGAQLFWTVDNAATNPTLTAETAGRIAGIIITTDAASDTYTVDFEGEIRNGSEFDFSVLTSGIGGGNEVGVALVEDTSMLSDGIIFTGTASGGLSTVNTSNGRLGVGNGQALNPGDVIRADFVTDVSVDTTLPLTQSEFNYGEHNDVSSVVQVVNRITGGSTSDLQFTAYNTDEDDTLILDSGDDVQVNLSVGDFTIYNGDPNGTGLEVLNGTMGLSITESGGVVTVSGMQQGWYYEINSDETFEAIEIEHDGGGAFTLGDISVGTLTDQDPFDLDIPVLGFDEDGDGLESNIEISVQPPVFIVGSNENDDGSNTNSYVVGDGAGSISGNFVDDILVGDSGGATSTGFVANYVLMLDTSGSMQGSRLTAMQDAVEAMINDLANSGGQDIRVYISEYGSTGGEVGAGHYDLIVNGVVDTSAVTSAISAVNGLNAGGWTNYEAGVQSAIDTIGDHALLTPGVDEIAINQAYFISDGAPTAYTREDGSTNTNTNTNSALGHVLGNWNQSGTNNDDNSSEIAILDALLSAGGSAGHIDAIGIQLGSGSTNLANLTLLDTGPGDADNVDTPTDLTSLLSDLNPLNDLGDAGNDVITGSSAGDLIFGDVMFTDSLADDNGLSTLDGAGWSVFANLEQNDPSWGRQDTLDYITLNHNELSEESVDSDGLGRAGGNDIINAGDGNDIVYGQEGTDTIDGGDGDDILNGGTGADNLTGGMGNDTFVIADDPSNAIDTITDYEYNALAGVGDVIDLTNYTGATSANVAYDNSTGELSVAGTVVAIVNNGSGFAGNVEVLTTSGSSSLKTTFNEPVPDTFASSALFITADDQSDDFGFDASAARGSFNSGFNGMAVLLGGMAMASEANAFENIFETLQPTFDASGFGQFDHGFAANDFNNALEMAFETANGLDGLMADPEPAIDSSAMSHVSPFTGEDLGSSDLLGSAFEGGNAGFEAISTPEIGGTDLAPHAFETGFGMPDLDLSNQLFLDTDLDDLLAQMPEIAADGTAALEARDSMNITGGSDGVIGIELGAFHGVMPDGLIPNGIDQGQSLTGLEDFHVLAMANSIAVI